MRELLDLIVVLAFGTVVVGGIVYIADGNPRTEGAGCALVLVGILFLAALSGGLVALSA